MPFYSGQLKVISSHLGLLMLGGAQIYPDIGQVLRWSEHSQGWACSSVYYCYSCYYCYYCYCSYCSCFTSQNAEYFCALNLPAQVPELPLSPAPSPLCLLELPLPSTTWVIPQIFIMTITEPSFWSFKSALKYSPKAMNNWQKSSSPSEI